MSPPSLANVDRRLGPELSGRWPGPTYGVEAFGIRWGGGRLEVSRELLWGYAGCADNSTLKVDLPGEKGVFVGQPSLG